MLLCFSFCEKLHDVLGFDWIMLFVLGNLNKSTVIRAARILFIILGHSPSLNVFKSGTSNGGWLKESHLVLSKRTKFAAGICLSWLSTSVTCFFSNDCNVVPFRSFCSTGSNQILSFLNQFLPGKVTFIVYIVIIYFGYYTVCLRRLSLWALRICRS